jgi:hypothetical protein
MSAEAPGLERPSATDTSYLNLGPKPMVSNEGTLTEARDAAIPERVGRLEREVASLKRDHPTVVVADDGSVFLPGSGWCHRVEVA